MSISETAAEVIAKMQAAMDEQNRLISQIDVERGPTSPENIEIAQQLHAAQADFEKARQDLAAQGFDV